MEAELTKPRADAVAAALGLTLAETPVCLLCLSCVSMALDEADGRRVAGELRRVTPDLWDEGLEAPALAAARRARALGRPDAAEAVTDLERLGGRSRVARGVVRLLAEELRQEVEANAARWNTIGSPPEGVRPGLN